MRFVGAAQELMVSYPDKSLALAQLGQEEVGKSLSMLSAFALRPDEDAWAWFWRDWNNHQVKAHRAFLYEIISPVRLEISLADGSRYAGEPLRPRLSQEKESGFYVDFDQEQKRFLKPETQVSFLEAASRLSTLSYLTATADGVRRALLNDQEEFRLSQFGQLAFRICTERIHQQDMPGMLEEFRKLSVQHEELVKDLEIALAANVEFLSSLPSQSGKDQVPSELPQDPKSANG